MKDLEQVAVVIPAYKPAQPFRAVVHGLRAAGARNIVVVDDGSPEECQPLFVEARRAGATVLAHSHNQGKGEALKTAFAYLLESSPQIAGAVTCDADGQHLIPDVLAVAHSFLRNQSSLVLGARHFHGVHIPLRSRLGNAATQLVFRLVVGKHLTDTQTGLRAVPRDLMRSLLGLKTGRYDFELDMLIHAFRSQVVVQEVPIAAVYTAKNELSHFNPLLDSARVYFVFFRFLLASVLSAIIDFLVFAAAQYFTGRLLPSMALARLTAGIVNFAIGRRFTFKSHGPLLLELVKYWMLVASYLLVSFSLVRTLIAEVGANVYGAKLVAEAAMFIFSFLVQRAYVFASSAVPTVASTPASEAVASGRTLAERGAEPMPANRA